MKIKKKATQKPLKKKATDHPELATQWTIRGITMESRNAAQKAAKKANEFVGSWISRKILEAAQHELTSKKEIARPEDMHDMVRGMHSDLAKMNEKIDYFTKRKSFLQKITSSFSRKDS